MAKVLIADVETKEMRTIKQTLELRDGHKVTIASDNAPVDPNSPALDSPSNHLLVYASNTDALVKMLSEQRFNIVFVGIRLIDDVPGKWVERLRGRITRPDSKNVPICLLSHLEDPKSIRNFINADIADVLVLPIDGPLFIQKFDLWVTGKLNTSDRQLFSLQTTDPIDVAVISNIEEISEFGVTVKTSLRVKSGDFVVFHGEFFGENGMGEVIGRCYSVSPHPRDSKFFLASFSFIGVTPATLKSVRRWIRQKYALKKQEQAS